MSVDKTSPPRIPPKPLPENIRSVQPGGGLCYQIELAWGKWRRWWLKTFRPGYVRRMTELREGSVEGCPNEIIDSRDLKYCRILCTAQWKKEHDPFRWRDSIPFARWGLAELFLMGPPPTRTHHRHGDLFLVSGDYSRRFFFALVVYFFRDPARNIPTDPGLIVSPADGKIAEITPITQRRLYRRSGSPDRHFFVDFQRPPQPVACRRTHYGSALRAGQIFERPETGKRPGKTKTPGSASKKRRRRIEK